MEAISPELVLVDPELRSRELARLPLPPTYRPVPTPPAGAPRAALELPPQRSVLVVLLASLLVNGILLAQVATGQRATQRPTLVPPAAPAPPTSLVSAPSPVPTTSLSPTTAIAASGPAEPARPSPQDVERRLLTNLVQQPARHLPPSLIDPATGLAKSNLQAICTRATARVISCLVRPAVHRPGEGLRVRYRPGTGFTWLRYRAGE
jgi:hypothetical protein